MGSFEVLLLLDLLFFVGNAGRAARGGEAPVFSTSVQCKCQRAGDCRRTSACDERRDEGFRQGVIRGRRGNVEATKRAPRGARLRLVGLTLHDRSTADDEAVDEK